MGKPVDALEEAFEDTKEILLPFSLNTWAKLGLIALIAGGTGFSMPSFPSGPNGYTGNSFDNTHSTMDNNFDSKLNMPADSTTGSFMTSNSAISLLSIGAALFVGIILVFMYISNVFSFIYYRSLLDKKVNIIGNFKNNMENGARYFIFSFFVGLFTIGSILGLVAAIFVNPLLIILMLIFLLPLFIAFTAIMTLIHDFALIEMLEEDKKLITSIKTMFGIFRTEWQQTLVYLVLKMVIGMITGIIGFIGAIITLLILLIPFGILGYLAFQSSAVLGGIIVVIGVLSFVALYSILFLGPLNTFNYYYAINVYSYFRKE